MDQQPARLSRLEHDKVLELIIDNPGARNALHPEMYRQGAEALEALAEAPRIGAVVLRGQGDTFCAGGNLNRLLHNRALDPSVQAASIDALHRWIKAIRRAPVPVIAAVEGPAAGAGFSLVLACDLVVASRESKFVMAYAKVGLTPDGGAVRALLQRLPPALVFELLADASPIGAERLYSLGCVNRLSPPGEAAAVALQWAERLANGPRTVLARLKRTVSDAAHASLSQALDQERDHFVQSLHESDAREGIEAFLAKRPARFGDPSAS